MTGASVTEFRAAVKALIEAEFAAERVPVRDDKLHESLGQDGPVVGVYPEAESPHKEQGVTNSMLVVVQVFARWDPQINPEQTVDPSAIEGWAWRLQRKIQSTGGGAPGTAKVWFYNVREISYPDDPTGNKTRFLMRVEGFGPTASMVETQA